MPNSGHGGSPGTRVMTPRKNFQKLLNLIKIGSLWAWKNLWGYGRKVHAKFWPWGIPWDLSYDPPQNLQKLLIQLKLNPFGDGKTFGDVVGRCMPNSGHGGCPGIRFMTI